MKHLFLTAAETGAETADFLSALSKLNLSAIVSAILIFIVGYILIKALTKVVEKVISRNQKLDESVRSLIVSVCRILLLFLLLLTCADKLGLPTTSIITLLGTFGLAFSLAMQNSLSNLAGGVFILFSKPFETGDYIGVPSAEGTVTQIGFIHTVLTTTDNRMIHVPNSTITGNTITNYSQNPIRKVELTIPVAYGSDLEKAKEVITRTVEADSRTTDAPFVRVWNLAASAVEIFVRVPCNNADYWECRSALLESIKVALDQAGIHIPYQQIDIHMIEKQ